MSNVREMKKVLLDESDVIVNDGELDNELMKDGWKLVEREMEYSKEYGWREVNWTPPLSKDEEIQQLKLALAEMAEAHEIEKTEMQLAIAELAELIGGEA